MQSWSDSFLNHVNDYSQILGLIALFLTVVFGYLAYATAKEAGRRASERESASNKKAEHLQQVASEANQRAQKLEALQAPRTISNEQRTRLIEILKNCPTGKVLVSANTFDGESIAYGKQILDVLVSSEINASAYSASGSSITLQINEPGLLILVNDAKNPPPQANFILNSFINVGISASLMNTNESIKIESDAVLIWSSRKS